MATISPASKDFILQEADSLQQRYAQFQSQSLALNMTRGKPSSEQLALSEGMLDLVKPGETTSDSGIDCRNYGGLDGLPEAKALFSAFLEVNEREIFIGDNSSLSLMHDAIMYAMLHGVPGGNKAWSKEEKVSFLCPVPGYDRHFNVCQHLGIHMIPVPMTEEGPDMEAVTKLVKEDASIKGIWIVPKYSNPTGIICSDVVVDQLAQMETAAPDFRIMWDNAYQVHHLVENPKPLKNILIACKESNHADRVWMFGSTSKITFAGSGLAVMGASETNLKWVSKHRSMQTIGPDKLNQLRHVRFFKDMDDIHTHMQKHAAILAPKFNLVDRILTKELGSKSLATWTKPEGGYFISLDVPDQCAQQVVKLAQEAGVKLTPAGATFPYKNDPNNRNIRIAPSLPPMEDIEKAIEVLAVCVQLAALEEIR